MRAALLLALALGAVSAAPVVAETVTASPSVAADTLPANVLVAETASGPHRFTIEIADDPVERSRGLMYREAMDQDAGMLFIFADESERAFWMKNTILPLDIIYADANGTVVSIAKDTTPFSTASIPSDGPTQYVLEVNAGVADEIGLEPGDKLIHRRIAR
ncbi:DUF192 domain-containing protein [Acuticoccus sediminis]|nr:DUF192 domain-containing protein [Acuticoccus sediminis]